VVFAIKGRGGEKIMKKLILSFLFSIFGIALFVAPVFAATPVTNNWGSQVNALLCKNKVGGPVINITENIINNRASGIITGPWALINYNQQIQVWSTGGDTYCAVVQYKGQFNAPSGAPAPQSTENSVITLTQAVSGTFAGGYVETFTGTLADGVQTMGSIGTLDYGCTDAVSGGGCNGSYYSWEHYYFPANLPLTKWYWAIYYAGSHGTWVDLNGESLGGIR
jgi:hypothetical protein